MLWEYEPEYVVDDNYDSGVFWYDTGKKAIPLADGNTELPQEVKFEAIQGEQRSIFDEPEQNFDDEVDIPDETYDNALIEPTEIKKRKTG